MAMLVTCGVARADEQAWPPGPGAAGLSVAALHSDLKFSLLTPAPARGEAAADALHRQARRLLGALASSATRLYPDALGRIGGFDVFVADSPDVGAASSASGRIALNAGFAALAPTDDWLAFVIAREMGHVIAGHHDSNSTASIITSVVMNLVLPGSQLVKSALSFAGSQAAAVGSRDRQRGEADQVAIRLLEGAGFTAKTLALNLAVGPGASSLGDSSWAQAFATTSQALLARFRPAPDARGGPVAVAAVAAGAAAAPAPGARHLGNPGSPSGLAPEDIVVTRRPSGMPGPLMLGGHLVPVRRIE
ncbi:MAG: M48 family metalloprotease [Burkholderiales bacterium]|nr:M48 family metalloprotease [Burkholderiales bacterium]